MHSRQSRPLSHHRSRFVTAAQQLLALAVVVALLTPAARTITMEVRPPATGPSDQMAPAGTSAYLRASTMPSTVPSGPVQTEVTEYALTAPTGARVAPQSLRASARPTTGGGEQVTSDTVPVLGYGAVGVTWEHGVDVGDDALGVEARSLQDGSWSDWTEVPYHDEHGPDPDSAEGKRARPGTDLLLVGDVDQVQVRIATDDGAPADLKLAVIDPGTANGTDRQVPDIDTDDLAEQRDGDGDGDGGDGGDVVDDTVDSSEGGIELQAQVAADRPKIFSRAQWGADERMRDRGSLSYHEVHAGFVHHTVNANDYNRRQVPGIIRGIYTYHTRTRGWSDIGYNFLVDRFGRIWEGRAGGVARPVVGAHTLGYNDDAFAMSAIGNFETTRPRPAMLKAYGALFAWKLGLHGVPPGARRQPVGGERMPAINGHRDVSATACPGRHLYAKIDRITTLAKQAHRGFQGRDLESDFLGGPRPDLVFRRASDGRVIIRHIRKVNGQYRLGNPQNTGLDLGHANQILRPGDWDLDGRPDLMARYQGALWLYRGLGGAKFGKAIKVRAEFGRVRKLAAVGDFTGDGRPDLVGQVSGEMRVFPGKPRNRLGKGYRIYHAVKGGRQYGLGRWDAGGASDTLVRVGRRVRVYYGNGPGGFTHSELLQVRVGRYDRLVGIDDVDVKGHSDLIARDRNGRLWLYQGTRKGLQRRVPIQGRAGGYDRVL